MQFDEWLEIDAYEPMATGAGEIAVDRYIPPKHKLAIRLFDTEYEVGELTLHLGDPTEDPPSRDDMIGGTPNHPLTLVMHPTRGVLNVGVVTGGPEIDWAPYLETVHGHLVGTCAVIREELRTKRASGLSHEFWSERPIPLGPAVVRGGAPSELEPRTHGIDPALCIDEAWECLPERLGEVMDHHTADIGDGETFLARSLATALKTMKGSATKYVDHIESIATWTFVGDQLFEGNDAA